jgi:signal transduction histidine kinase
MVAGETMVSRDQLLRAGQKEVLALAAAGAPVQEVLTSLVRAAQAVTADGARAAIFIFDPEAACLRFLTAHGLSSAYTSAVDRFAIGVHQPSCGKAAFTGNEVIVGDVAQDEQWQPYLALAIEHDIAACWSFPLKSPEGELLGTFALYHRSPQIPDAAEHEEVKFCANIAALVIQRDIEMQERTEQEKALQHAKELEAQNKDRFLAILGHELRNPLAALSSAISLLEIKQDKDTGLEAALGVLKRQTKQLERLSNDVLEVGLLAQGKLELRYSLVRVRQVLEQATEAVKLATVAKDQQLLLLMPPGELSLEGDSGRLVQLVTNLLTNASKFTAAGGHITLTAQQSGDHILITVSDTGIGLESGELEKLFVLFSRANSATSTPGLGIGLALSKGIANAHGGDIEVMSRGIGLGSTFTARLPIKGSGGLIQITPGTTTGAKAIECQ